MNIESEVERAYYSAIGKTGLKPPSLNAICAWLPAIEKGRIAQVLQTLGLEYQ